MPLTILSDSQVKEILENLTKEDVETLQESMKNALHEYSTGKTNDGACANNQPKRTISEWKDGSTSLFMPSTSSAGIGLKGQMAPLTTQAEGGIDSCTVVTLPAPQDSAEIDEEPEYEETAKGPILKAALTTAQGALTIMSNDGRPTGFLNAEEITAFRTALASSILLIRRSKVKTLTVFGTGKQAYWHVRLALKLRGSTIRRVYFINRVYNTRVQEIMTNFMTTKYIDLETKEREGWKDCLFNMVTPSYGEYDRLLKEQVRKADVIFCTTPSTEPLFDHTILTNTEGRKKGRLIVAIGSYKPHMIELPPEILLQAVKFHGAHAHYHRHAEEGGVIVIDTLASTKESGEFVQAQIDSSKSVELGELVMLDMMDETTADESAIDDSPSDSLESTPISTPLSPHDTSRSALASIFRENSLDNTSANGSNSKSPSRKSSFSSISRKSSFVLRRRHGSAGSLNNRPKKKQTEKEDQRSRWLSRGNVVYKSVGLGLMDLVVGGDLVKLAREKGIGVMIDEF
jgi:ornithine cyclodeaminase/alanine dehydrogenase-like protein (mu-crystallin family)